MDAAGQRAILARTAITPQLGLILNSCNQRSSYAVATMLWRDVQTRKPWRDRMEWLKFRAHQQGCASQNVV